MSSLGLTIQILLKETVRMCIHKYLVVIVHLVGSNMLLSTSGIWKHGQP